MSLVPESPATPTQYPLLPLRDVVVFPHMVIPLFVGRPKSIKAMEIAMESGKSILLVAQKSATKDDPGPQDMYEVGCVSNILQMLKLPDGTVKVLVEGGSRALVRQATDMRSHWVGEASLLAAEGVEAPEVEAMRRALLSAFDQYVKLNKKIDILQVEKRIRGRVKRQMEKSQREYYLNEQVKAIQKELGEGEEGADLEEMDKRIKRAKMPKEARKKAESELKKLKLMSPMSAEATVVRNYIETLTNLPWRKRSKISKDIKAASEILDRDHYGLEKVKERILEYLAVQSRVEQMKAPILCLVGPPGVGKTSLGQSIARATNRKFVRMSLGGVRDEAEIRGHRRTYIGSMPGKILQNMSKVAVRNPLFLLDEVDKLGMDWRGDPSSALLEVLDPEQNHTFVDHYIEVEYDLSEVMFVATANTLNIPPALADRMEVIRLSGYTEDEKLNIATRYLLPKQMKNSGLKSGELSVNDAAIRDTIRYYTREAGVRSLEREMSKICRKAVTQLVVRKAGDGKKKGRIVVTPRNLDKFLGVRRFTFGMAEKDNQIGQVTGLAWTEFGGELLTIEAITMPGKGKTITTGKLGEVMQESIQAALSVVRNRSRRLGVAEDFYQKNDIHIHLPEGAVPKDGPSAGIGIVTAMISMLTGIPVRADVAMTGEITLRGEVLAIGGLKEKLLAAVRGGIKTVMIPEENTKDLAEIPENVKNRLEIIPVKWIDKVLEVALAGKPEPLPEPAPSVPVPESEEGKPGTGIATHH
jgi:ATP-dependent Lon protease